jgi:hypothetical protein
VKARENYQSNSSCRNSAVNLIGSCALLAVLIVGCESDIPKKSKGAIYVEPSVHQVISGTNESSRYVGDVSFTLRNMSDSVRTVLEVKPHCGCLSVTTDVKEILPGATARQ